MIEQFDPQLTFTNLVNTWVGKTDIGDGKGRRSVFCRTKYAKKGCIGCSLSRDCKNQYDPNSSVSKSVNWNIRGGIPSNKLKEILLSQPGEKSTVVYSHTCTFLTSDATGSHGVVPVTLGSDDGVNWFPTDHDDVGGEALKDLQNK